LIIISQLKPTDYEYLIGILAQFIVKGSKQKIELFQLLLKSIQSEISD